MECMRTGNRDQSCDCRVHAFQTDWTCGEFIRIAMRNGLGDGIFHVDDHGQNVHDMAYLRLYDLNQLQSLHSDALSTYLHRIEWLPIVFGSEFRGPRRTGELYESNGLVRCKVTTREMVSCSAIASPFSFHIPNNTQMDDPIRDRSHEAEEV